MSSQKHIGRAWFARGHEPQSMADPRIPLSEYDGPGEAVIEPSRVIAPISGAERAVFCFF